jgi:hypothetical protein
MFLTRCGQKAAIYHLGAVGGALWKNLKENAGFIHRASPWSYNK